MSIELLAELRPVEGGPDVRDGWRGIVDFGEVWTDADAGLWPAGSGDVRGEPLVYGCEVRALDTEGDRDPRRYRAKVVLWSLDEPRDVMAVGAKLTLKDGTTPRATGYVLSDSDAEL